MNWKDIKDKYLRPKACEFCVVYAKEPAKAWDFYKRKIEDKAMSVTSTELKMMKQRLSIASSEYICPMCGANLFRGFSK